MEPLYELASRTLTVGYDSAEFSDRTGCTETDFKISGEGSTSSRIQISPGTYCNGIAIESAAHVNFIPGTYYLKGGGLCQGGGYAYMPFQLMSGSHVDFSAQQGENPDNSQGSMVEITVQYPYQPVVALFQTMTLRASSRMAISY